MHRSVFAVVALAVSLVLAGCSPGDPGPSTSSISPSVSALSPDAEMAALYAEAEQVFLQSLELRDRFELLGDYSMFPAELEEVLADPYLAWMRSLYEYGKEHGLHAAVDSEPGLIVRPYPGVSREGSDVALQACQDTRMTPALDSDGNVFSEGSLSYLELYFQRIDGKLRLFYGTHVKVEQCPLS